MIHVGDKLREVSGVSMRGKAPEEVVEIVVSVVVVNLYLNIIQFTLYKSSINDRLILQ